MGADRSSVQGDRRCDHPCGLEAAWLRRVIHAGVEAELVPVARSRARELLAGGMEVDAVVEATGLAIAEVEGLQSK